MLYSCGFLSAKLFPFLSLTTASAFCLSHTFSAFVIAHLNKDAKNKVTLTVYALRRQVYKEKLIKQTEDVI